MKNTKKGVLQFFVVLLVLAGLGAFLYLGYTNDNIPGVKDIGLGLDLEGGLSVTYQTADGKVPDADKFETTIDHMQQRVEFYSTEAEVYKQGDNRICADIPGVKDADRILADLGKSGNVYFVYGKGTDGIANIKEDKKAKSGYSLARSIDEIRKAGQLILSGSEDLVGAEPKMTNDKNNASSYLVELKLNGNGQQKFKKASQYTATKYNSGSNSMEYIIAIIYDDEVISAPTCREVIDSNSATITGNFTYKEVKELANTIDIGALPIELTQIQSSIVGAQLGSNALRTILIAGVIGLCFVMLFMIFMYRIPGFCSSIALIFYTGIMMLLLLLFDVTLTLPGIAGIILSIGMAVDANVIIFTRIKEELRAGKTVRSAIKLGFSKALSAIVDGNITTLIAAFVLYARGSGTIRGFAITLALGIVLSMFTALVVTRFLLYCAYNLGFTKEKFYGIAKPTKIINFTKHWLKYTLVSGVLILAGLVALIINKNAIGNVLNFGLDFVGGTSIEVHFDDTDYQVKDIANVDIEKLATDNLKSSAEVVKVKDDNAFIIKTDKMIKSGEANNTQVNDLQKALKDKYGVSEDKIQIQAISATVSGEMRSNAIWAVIIAGICMLLYIWFRFSNLAFAGSAVIALLHDVLVVFGVYSVCRITVDNSFIACMLTIVGYSINATIVIFDRIRENLSLRGKKDTLDDVVNKSISETLSRSINTSLTTMFSIVMIVILGVDSIQQFAIPLLVGLVCGTYSSICITGTLWRFMRRHGKNAE